MVKVEITRKGFYDAKGEEVPVGTKLDFKDEPKALKGKYKVISGASESKQDKTLETGTEALRAQYKGLTGKNAANNWSDETLKDKIAEVEKDKK